jgi:hypothetical protein
MSLNKTDLLRKKLIYVFFYLFIFSEVFCDFGQSFWVNDSDGEQPVSNMLASITKVFIS